MNPKVSFIVPCYKFGHLLADCVLSILDQTFRDFELIIMDDCSPDNTPEIAAGFKDERVIYVRNERNLGHLRSYNKAINISRGEYIWLISADDRIRRNYALKLYVALMELHPNVGWIFCPGIALYDSDEGELIEESQYGKRDAIFPGKDFVLVLLWQKLNLLAPGVMVRRNCYQHICYFPEDLPHRADSYIWCRFSMEYDVGYFAEPMVNYRYHNMSMTQVYSRENIRICVDDAFSVVWRIRDEFEHLGDPERAGKCDLAIAELYGQHLATKAYRGGSIRMSLAEFEQSLQRYASSDAQKQRIRGKAYASAGDRCYWGKRYDEAWAYYKTALNYLPDAHGVRVKCALLRAGVAGQLLRDIGIHSKATISWIRERSTRHQPA